jgi:hypothetical protein
MPLRPPKMLALSQPSLIHNEASTLSYLQSFKRNLKEMQYDNENRQEEVPALSTEKEVMTGYWGFGFQGFQSDSDLTNFYSHSKFLQINGSIRERISLVPRLWTQDSRHEKTYQIL